MAHNPLDKIADAIENITNDIDSEAAKATAIQPYKCIADAVMKIANAVGVEVPKKNWTTQRAMIADVLDSIAEADISVGGGATKLSDLLNPKTISGTLEVPEGITDIVDGMYSNCSRISQVSIPDTVKTIGDEAFGGLGASSGLDSGTSDLELTNVETVGAGAFGGSKIIRSVKLDKCTFIDYSAFGGNINLESIILPSIVSFGTSKNGATAFGGCTKCSYIYLGPDCKEIPTGTFSGVPITCKVECGFAEGAVAGFPANAGFAGNPASLDITYNVAEPPV